MTNQDKLNLISACKHEWEFDDIKDKINCSDTTIRKYLKIFSPLKPKQKEALK